VLKVVQTDLEGQCAAVERTFTEGGPGSKAAGPAMAYQLITVTQDRWRAVNAAAPATAA
jgi:hypothetical protein